MLARRMIALVALCGAEVLRSAPPVGASLPDVSGMAWMGGDLFIAVHDRKQTTQGERPHISLLRVPGGKGTPQHQAQAVRWPGALGAGHDLESVARIPGRQELLLVESGDEGGPWRRIFHGRLAPKGLELIGSMAWPHRVRNVEGTAVAQVGNRLVFLYAERAHGQSGTRIRWADLQLAPLRLGHFRDVPVVSPGRLGHHQRPVTALEVDGNGQLYGASASDPGHDDGPFRSLVWRVGRIGADGNGEPRLVLDPNPPVLAELDNVKVEALAIRASRADEPELFVGVDNENRGGKIRRLPLTPQRKDRQQKTPPPGGEAGLGKG